MHTSRLLPVALVPLGLSGAASAQMHGLPVFSIDWHSPTVSVPNTFTGWPITEGDVLAAQPLYPALGPLPPPGIVESGGVNAPAGLGLAGHLACVGHPGGTPCTVEVDALSYGLDALTQCNSAGVVVHPAWMLSVSYRGLGNSTAGAPPSVYTEGQCAEEAADVYYEMGFTCGPAPISPFPPGNTGFYDGNGLVNCTGAWAFPGFGLFEGNTAMQGDNLDALDVDVPDQWLPSTTCAYFSLDSAFLDPVLGTANSGSAAAHGFQPGDVLMSCPGCTPVVYASAAQLGLDLAGPGTDDLDALVLHENGVAGYQRSTAPYDWLTTPTDMLFFSVRRGSAVVGVPDSLQGIPIEPGDILVPPLAVGAPPGLWIPAEELGLTAQRTTPGVVWDDLDALDTLHGPPAGSALCFGDGSGTPCPCLNNGAPGRGCGNSVNALGALLWATGNPSITNDTVLLSSSGMPGATTCRFIQGTAAVNGGLGAVFGDGLRCAGGSVVRLGTRSALCGNREFGFQVAGDPPVHIAGGISSPGSYVYQVWYRNAAAFCTSAVFNFSNAYRIAWQP